MLLLGTSPIFAPMRGQPKWALPLWGIGAVFTGSVFAYEMLRGDGFRLYQLALFVMFAAMALEMWRQRRRGVG